MNLLRDPWIPVLRASGREERIAPWQLTEVSSEGALVALAAPRPDFAGSLAQVLIGLLQSVMTPKDERAWRKSFAAPPGPEALQSAFEPLTSSFELFGEGPRVFQDLTLEQEGVGEIWPIESIFIEVPWDSSLSLGAEKLGEAAWVSALCPSCAASALSTLQINAPAGGRGHRTGLRGGGPLTTLVLGGDSLWHLLWLNVLPATDLLSGNPERHRPEDRYPWLAPTRTSEKDQGVETTPEDVDLLQVFWPMPRRVRLRLDEEPGVCSVCGEGSPSVVRSYLNRHSGVNYLGYWPHPLGPFREDKGVRFPLRGDSTDLTYRNWTGLVLGDRERNVAPAPVLSHLLAGRAFDLRLPLRVWAFGYATDKAKAKAWLDGEMPLFLLPPERREAFATDALRLVLAARAAQRALDFAVRLSLPQEPSDLKWDSGSIGPSFWGSTEARFYTALAELAELPPATDTEPVRRAWHRSLVHAANAIFETATGSGFFGSGDPKRIARAWNGLQRTLYGPKMREALGVARFSVSPPLPPEPETDDDLVPDDALLRTS